MLAKTLICLFTLGASSLCLAADPAEEAVQRVRDLQRVYRAPYNLVVLRWVRDEDGTCRAVCRSQNNPYGAPTSVAMIQIAGANSVPERIIHDAGHRLIDEYETGRHRLPAPLAAKMRQDITAALKNRDSRSVWYAIHSPAGRQTAERISATIRLYDATATPGEPAPESQIETWLGWTYPERAKKKPGSIDLQFAFQNADPLLKQLESAGYLMAEVGTYLDLFYVSRGLPVTVRFVTTHARARVFCQKEAYGFVVDAEAPVVDSDLVTLKMDGSEFVKRFGSRWPVWKEIYGLSEAPPNFLLDATALRANVKRRLTKAKSQYDCIASLVSQGGHAVAMESNSPLVQTLDGLPSFEGYLDGLFRPVMDAAETALLF